MKEDELVRYVNCMAKGNFGWKPEIKDIIWKTYSWKDNTKWILKGKSGRVWRDLFSSGWKWLAGSCNHSTDPFDSINCRGFPYYIWNNQLLKTNSFSLSYLVPGLISYYVNMKVKAHFIHFLRNRPLFKIFVFDTNLINFYNFQFRQVLTQWIFN